MKTKNFLANPNICMLEINGTEFKLSRTETKIHLERLLFISAVRERAQFSGINFR